jgi:hypothetical protein
VDDYFPVIEQTGSFQLLLSHLKKFISTTGETEQIITIPHSSTLDLPVPFDCIIDWGGGDGAKKIEIETGVTLQYPIDDLPEISEKYNAVQLKQVKKDVWRVFGATKTEKRGYGGMMKILSVNGVSLESLYWLQVYKAIDYPEFTISTDYFCLFSTDHDALDGGSTNGGIVWGECDDPYLTNFVEKGTIQTGFESETPWLIRVPTAESGIADEIFLFFHNQDPANDLSTGQSTRLITTSGGAAPHLCTWTDKGNPLGTLAGWSHTGYCTVHRIAANDYIAHHFTGDANNAYWISSSTDCLTFTPQEELVPVTVDEGVFLVTSVIFPFERNGTNYAFASMAVDETIPYIAICTVDANARPLAFVQFVRKQYYRDLNVFIEGDTAYINVKGGTSNSDNKHDYYGFEFDLTKID